MRKAFYQYAKMSHFLPAIFARKKVKEKYLLTKIQLLRFVKLHLKMIRGNFSEDCRNFAINVPKKGYINLFKMVERHTTNLGN